MKLLYHNITNFSSSAPSIPGKGDQFGYDQTSQGTLRKQVVPKKGYKGRDGDTVGPGAYNTAKNISHQAKGGSNFGRSTSTRDDGREAEKAHLGPGTYDITGDNNVLRHRQPMESGNFKSNTKRPDPATKGHGSGPGPGAYVPPSSFKVYNIFIWFGCVCFVFCTSAYACLYKYNLRSQWIL